MDDEQLAELHPDFLKLDDDYRLIQIWSSAQADATRPFGATVHQLIYDEAIKRTWRDNAANRIAHFGKARCARLIKFEVTEETPPDPTKLHIWVGVNVTAPIPEALPNAGLADRIAEIIAQHTDIYIVSAHGIALEILAALNAPT